MQDITFPTLACSVCSDPFAPRHSNHRACPKPACKRALASGRAATFLAAHPGAGADASRRHRATYGPRAWPAKRALGREVTVMKEATPCTDCGGTFPSECMDFDHAEGTEKVNNVGTMVSHGHSRESVLAEIAKCELVCANCHRTRTKNRRTRVAFKATLVGDEKPKGVAA